MELGQPLESRVVGRWCSHKGTMEQLRCQDPVVVSAYPVNMHVYSDHFFAAVPAAAAKEVMVKATDRFGQVYEEKIQLA